MRPPAQQITTAEAACFLARSCCAEAVGWDISQMWRVRRYYGSSCVASQGAAARPPQWGMLSSSRVKDGQNASLICSTAGGGCVHGRACILGLTARPGLLFRRSKVAFDHSLPLCTAPHDAAVGKIVRRVSIQGCKASIPVSIGLLDSRHVCIVARKQTRLGV